MNYEKMLDKLEERGISMDMEEIMMEFHGETYHNGYAVDICAVTNGNEDFKVSLYVDADDKEELASKLSGVLEDLSQKLNEISAAVKTNEKKQILDEIDL